MKSFYPVMLDIEGKLCIIVGGGKVALRKVSAILNYGAKIKVISSKLCDGLLKLRQDKKIGWISKDYEKGDLKGAFLVFACTDNNDVNKSIKKECEEKDIIANIIDSPDDCDFIVPSKIERGNLTIAISTSGKSPALAKKIREQLESEFGENYADFLDILGNIREKSLLEISSMEKRENLFRELVNSKFLAKLEKQDKNIVIREMERIFERYKNDD